mmetsp:Transcript_18739/g.65046  ORF Transcript_18739/g.65046 Transcript_18739/m.65046 type:complete len:425 (-) Transcript_18739:792-2066(-)
MRGDGLAARRRLGPDDLGHDANLVAHEARRAREHDRGQEERARAPQVLDVTRHAEVLPEHVVGRGRGPARQRHGPHGRGPRRGLALGLDVVARRRRPARRRAAAAPEAPERALAVLLAAPRLLARGEVRAAVEPQVQGLEGVAQERVAAVRVVLRAAERGPLVLERHERARDLVDALAVHGPAQLALRLLHLLDEDLELVQRLAAAVRVRVGPVDLGPAAHGRARDLHAAPQIPDGHVLADELAVGPHQTHVRDPLAQVGHLRRGRRRRAVGAVAAVPLRPPPLAVAPVVLLAHGPRVRHAHGPGHGRRDLLRAPAPAARAAALARAAHHRAVLLGERRHGHGPPEAPRVGRGVGRAARQRRGAERGAQRREPELAPLVAQRRVEPDSEREADDEDRRRRERRGEQARAAHVQPVDRVGDLGPP